MKVFRIKLVDYTPFGGEPDPLWTEECPVLIVSADNIMSIILSSTADVIIIYDNSTNYDRIHIKCADPLSASGTAAASSLIAKLFEGLKHVHSSGYTDIVYDIELTDAYIENYTIS